MTKSASVLLLSAATVALAGCQRGCLTTWLEDRGVDGVSPQGARGEGPAAPVPMRGQDCPDGLARCEGETVAASRLYSYTLPCEGTPEQCSCPWDNVAGCDRGCVVEGLELVMEKGVAAAQLCAPSPGDIIAAAPPADGLSVQIVCDASSYHCAGGVALTCEEGTVPKAIATCVHGCADDAAEIDGDDVTWDEAVAILCARPPGTKPLPAPASRHPPKLAPN